MISPTPSDFEKNFCGGSPTQKMTLEPIFRILEAIVTEKLNCFKFVCYTVINGMYYHKNDHSDQTKPPKEPKKVPKDSPSWAFQRGW